MIWYLLLLVFVILMTALSIGLVIYSLYKKKKKRVILGVGLFVTFTLLSVFCGYLYVSKSVDYFASKEFGEEARKKGEGIGQNYGATISGTAQGLAETLDDKAIAALANKTVVIGGKIVKATDAGLDSTMAIRILCEKSIEDQGIVIGKVLQNVEDSPNKIGVYLDFGKAFKETLRLTSYDLKGNKMDVASMAINEKSGSGKVIVFSFQYAPPGPNGYCILSIEHNK